MSLDPLVESTRGLQPWRRVFHAANGVLIAAIVTVVEPSRTVVVGVGASLLVLQLALDLVRLRVPAANVLFFRWLRHLVTPREASGVASSTWYTLGVVVSLALFPPRAAVSGILVLALADPAASYLGRRFGRAPFLGGTLEGALVFALVCFVVLATRHPVGVAALASVVLPIIERRSWPVDDNLAVPVVTAALMTWLGSPGP